jgi:hypothetical protein
MPFKPREGFRRKEKKAVPPEVLAFFKHGLHAYKANPTFETDPDQLCWETYLLCGQVIHNRHFGRSLWDDYRDLVLPMKGVKDWWAFGQYESKHVK